MKNTLGRVTASAVRAFLGTAIVTYFGLGTVPDLSQKGAVYIAALTAGGAATLRVLQAAFPGLTLRPLLARFGLEGYTATADSFARAFLSSLTVFGLGVLEAPTLNFDRAAWSAAIVGAATSAFRIAESVFTKGESPAPAKGATD